MEGEIKPIVVSKKGLKYPTAKSLQNLRPLNTRSKEDQWRIRSLGGKAHTNSPKAKVAARLREMKKNGLTDDNSKFLYDMMMDSEMAAMHILDYIQKLLKSSDKPIEMNAAVKTTMDWYKIKHGTRENDRKTATIIIHLTPEEKEEEILRLLS